MPPDHRLSDQQIADLKSWIDDGAAWPALVIPAGVDQSLDKRTVHEELKKSHWAWQPVNAVAVPELDPANPLFQWARTDVDKFIAKSLGERGLKPVSDASKAVLLRRLSYDLTGLPPTQEELLAFSLDESEKAIENVVDKLLSSKAFGNAGGGTGSMLPGMANQPVQRATFPIHMPGDIATTLSIQSITTNRTTFSYKSNLQVICCQPVQ